MLNDDVLAGKWKQVRGKVQEQWGKLTNDDLDKIEGKRDQMVGLLQEKYGYAKERAEKEYDEFTNSLNSSQGAAPKATTRAK